VPDVQTVGRGIEADVNRARLLIEPGAKGRIGGLMNEATPLEICEERHGEELMISDLGFLMLRSSCTPPSGGDATAHHKSEIPNQKSLIPRLTPEVVAREWVRKTLWLRLRQHLENLLGKAQIVLGGDLQI